MAYFILFAGIILAAVAQLSFKKGVEEHQLTLSKNLVFDILSNKFIVIGFLIYGFGSIVWLFLLKKFPLSILYPAAISSSYVLVYLGSTIIFNEPVTATKTLGVLLTLLGIFFLLK
jgi:multidrug transporter EmrE-like cation transporter